MNKFYISPEVEILFFLPAENMANGGDWYNGDQMRATELSDGEIVDATIPGSGIPGWGN